MSFVKAKFWCDNEKILLEKMNFGLGCIYIWGNTKNWIGILLSFVLLNFETNKKWYQTLEMEILTPIILGIPKEP